jgi:hypothetical protein
VTVSFEFEYFVFSYLQLNPKVAHDFSFSLKWKPFLDSCHPSNLEDLQLP